MRHRLLLCCSLICCSALLPAQKTAYIPNYLQNPNNVDGAQFTWSKTRQSANFTLIWGNTVGVDPASYPDPNLAFDPEAILDTMEMIYTVFKGLGFLDDAAGTNLSLYKIPIVIYGTWGANGAQGFANGGDADGVIGAFWVHPNAMHDGAVAAHELAHSLQAQCVIDYRANHGLGPVWNNAGIFWETHANFMRNLLYPQAVSAWGMDVYHTETFGDWKNTYENYELLLAIMESEGIDMVNRLWRESLSQEYPLQTYKRLAGYNQAQFNDSLFGYARRMATFDFSYNNIGKFFRQYRSADLNNYLYSIQATYSILNKIPGAADRFEIPIELAPEEFAYNVIPLYPIADSCAVIVKFKGHTEANPHAGWRYGFVAAHPNGTISRYSPTYSDNTSEINFRLEGDETKMYLVVMGAPFDQITTNPSNDTWQGYPKHFRYPYELNISGALPEGHQAPAAFRAQLKNGGHLHPNGGGWVQHSATVAASVFVGPAAMVLGNSNISGQVRIENTAFVKNAQISGQVVVRNNAFINGGTYGGNAIVQGQGFAENVTMSNSALIGMRAKVTNYKLSGTVEVGGDVVVYNEDGNCNNGVHYRLTNYYDNKLLECDGRTANHPANKDVNNTYALFSNADMAPQCQCAYETAPIILDSMQISPVTCQAADAGSVQFFISKSCGPFQYTWSKGAESGTQLSGLEAGTYVFTITDALGRDITVPVQIPDAPALVASISATPFDCFEGAGGSATATLADPATMVSYHWENGANTASITGLNPGAYALTITDTQGCTFSSTVEVGISGQLHTELIINPIRCHDSADGSIRIEVQNGTTPYTWLWQNGETVQQLQDLGPGDYSATVTNAYGCRDQQQITMTAPEILELFMQGPAVLCPAQTGILSATVSGGTTPYFWSWGDNQAEETIAVTGAGQYALTLTDANGCTQTAMWEILPADPLDLQLETTPVSCFAGSDGSALIQSLNGAAPFSWQWSGGQTDSVLQQLPAGSYQVTVTDILGCSSTVSFVLEAPSPLVLQTMVTPVLCFGMGNGTAAVTITGGTPDYTFSWNTQATTGLIQNLSPGIYSVTVTDAQACTAVAEMRVESPPPMKIIIDAPDILCAGASGIASASITGGTPPYFLFWDTGEFTSEISIQAGAYEITVIDAQGCPGVQSGFIQEATEVLVNAQIQHASGAIASDGEIRLISVMGGIAPFTYLWSNGASTASLENIPPGEYMLSISDAAGCEWHFSYVVSFETAVHDQGSLDVNASIVPNPSALAARLWLEVSEAQFLNISILDVYGKILYKKESFVQKGETSIELPQTLSAGAYWVRIRDVSGKGLILVWVVG